jgi:DNA-binding NarL/FixJ family response regulator
MAKILIAEDKLAYAQLIADKLKKDGLSVVGIARTSKAALELVDGNSLDLLLVGVVLHESWGLDVVNGLPPPMKSRVLLLAGPVRPMPLVTALVRGVGGVFDLTMDVNLSKAVTTVLNGGRYYSPSLIELMATIIHLFMKEFTPSKPEIAVLNGVRRGLIQKQIALESSLSESSVSRAVSSLKKLVNIPEKASYDEFVRQIVDKGLMEIGGSTCVSK